MLRVGAKKAKGACLVFIKFNIKAEQYWKSETCLLDSLGPLFPSTLSIPLLPFPQALILCFMITLNQ